MCFLTPSTVLCIFLSFNTKSVTMFGMYEISLMATQISLAAYLCIAYQRSAGVNVFFVRISFEILLLLHTKLQQYKDATWKFLKIF